MYLSRCSKLSEYAALLPALQVIAKHLVSKLVLHSQNGFGVLVDHNHDMAVNKLSAYLTDATRFLDAVDLRVGYLGHISLTAFLYPTLLQRDWTWIALRLRLSMPLCRFRSLPLHSVSFYSSPQPS